jgi:hypothetical protein
VPIVFINPEDDVAVRESTNHFSTQMSTYSPSDHNNFLAYTSNHCQCSIQNSFVFFFVDLPFPGLTISSHVHEGQGSGTSIQTQLLQR